MCLGRLVPIRFVYGSPVWSGKGGTLRFPHLLQVSLELSGWGEGMVGFEEGRVDLGVAPQPSPVPLPLPAGKEKPSSSRLSSCSVYTYQCCLSPLLALLLHCLLYTIGLSFSKSFQHPQPSGGLRAARASRAC